jgi:hypothetical protein
MEVSICCCCCCEKLNGKNKKKKKCGGDYLKVDWDVGDGRGSRKGIGGWRRFVAAVEEDASSKFCNGLNEIIELSSSFVVLFDFIVITL